MVIEEDPDDAVAQVRGEQLLEALSDQDQVQQLHQALQNEGMRDFLWRVLIRCHIYRSSYNRNSHDMAMTEGERSIGLWLVTEIAAADPEALLAMQTKAHRLAAAAAEKERKRRTRRQAPRE